MRIVGTCKDVKNNALITFISSGDGHDAIQRIWSDGRVEKIANYDFRFGYIVSANVVGDLLYWTDGLEIYRTIGFFNPPRKINLLRASAMTNQFLAPKLYEWDTGASYLKGDKIEYLSNIYVAKSDNSGRTPTDTTYWRFARTKWVAGEIAGYGGNCYQCLQDSDVALPTDSVYWKLVEYKHYTSLTFQNIMRGKLPPLQPTWAVATDPTIKKNNLRDKIFQFRSRFIYDDNEKSTWSCMSTPTLLNLEYDGYFADPSVNNTINVTLQTGTKEVVRIQIACRINGGDWVLVDDLHKYTPSFGVIINSNTTTSYVFRNDIVTLPLDQTETNNLFSYVPQISKCQEVIKGERIVDADIIEGYDYPAVACALSVDYNTVDQITETSLTSAYSSTLYLYTLPSFSTLDKVSMLNFIIPVSLTQKITFEYFKKNETTIALVLAAIVSEMGDVGITATTDGTSHISITSANFGSPDFIHVTIPDRTGGLKYSSTVNPGIVFFDELKRSCSVVKLDSLQVESVNDAVGGTTVSSLPVPQISFSLTGDPPDWAYSYKFCHTDNRYLFLDIAVPSAYIVDNFTARKVSLNIDQAVLNYRDIKPNSVVEPWVWVKGDRIRILGYSSFDSIEYLQKEYDIELSVETINGVPSYVIPYQNLDFNRDWMIEVYRDVPINQNPSVYFETGKEYLITNPRTSIAAYATTSGTIDMYDAFQRSSSQKGSYAYVLAGGSGLGGLEIFDTSIPTSPQIIVKQNLLANARFITIIGIYAYVLYDTKLQVWDISNPVVPIAINDIDLGTTNCMTVRIHGGYAYIVSQSATLTVVNVTSPTSLVKYPAIALTAGAEDIAIYGNRAFVSSFGSSALDVVDISNPQIPVLGTPVSGLNQPRRMFLSGNLLFVADSGSNNLLIFNVAGTPYLISTTAIDQNPYSVFVLGKFAYTVSFNDGSHGSIQKIDISSIYVPVVVGSVNVGIDPEDLYVSGIYAYTANYTSDTVSVVDTTTMTVEATTPAWGNFKSIVVSGSSPFNCIESKDYSDTYKSDQGDLQRVAVYSLELKRQRITTMLRWSGVYLQSTNKNDLSFVDAFNYEQVNETFGGITKLFEFGDILNCIQLEKVTSFYLSQAVLKQAAQSGVDIIATSTDVLGSRHQSAERLGCQNSESFVQNGSIFYYADIISGAIVRNGSSESVVISDLGIKNFIKNLFAKIKNYYPFIVGGYDRSKGELWYTIYAYISGDIQKWTLMYNEENRSWVSFFDFVDGSGNVPECYGDIGLSLYAFISGVRYLHEGDTTYSKFFGVTVQPKVNIVGKGNGKSVFNSIKIISNKEWKSDNIYIFDDAEYVRMQSKLPKMVKKENYFYSPFLRNAITTNPTFNARDLFNGDTLRGDTALIELKTIESGLTQMYSVEVTTTPSL